MSALVRSDHAPLAGRSRRTLVVGMIVVAIGLTLGGRSARADQTVSFDDAPGAPHISIVGDSTLTGVRWYADYGALERFNFVLSAESCRRTIEQSCISREGYQSANVLTAMRTLEGDLGEVLVVMSGYNDPRWTIDEAITGVVEEARGQGVEHVLWLTLRTSPDVDYSDPQEQTSINTFREYNEQLIEAAASSDSYLQVADWATYSNGASSWFEADGVHLTPQGVDALTTFIAGTVERLLAGEDVSPAAAPWTVLVPGAEGEVVADVQAALIRAGVEVAGGADGAYGNDTMAAVAEYQRAVGALQVTGAVDAATARSLDVYQSSDDATPATSAVPAINAPPSVAAAIDPPLDPTVSRADEEDKRGPGVRWIAAAVVVVSFGAAFVGRRRYVVSRRRARRWARVHPATSPHRSVADLRRSGELAASEVLRQRGTAVVFDQEARASALGSDDGSDRRVDLVEDRSTP